jgi:HSP20 family protein
VYIYHYLYCDNRDKMAYPTDMFDDLLTVMQPRISSIVQDFCRELDSSKIGRNVVGNTRGGMWSVDVDLVKKTDRYEVQADLPGLSKSDVKIEINEEGVLTLSGERKQTDGMRVRRHGWFTHLVSLPDDADINVISAKMENGVLTVSIQRVQKDKPPANRSIQVE